MYKLGLEKAEEPEIKLPYRKLDYRESKGILKKKSTSASLTTLKPLCGSQQTVENSSRDGKAGPPYLSPEKPVCGSRSNS